jgi:hypothetical protein
MIKEAKLGKEIVVTVVNKIGVLADMSRLLADHGINIEAVAGYGVDKEARIMLVAEDNVRAVEALQNGGYKSITEEEVVIVDLENKPGVLKDITAKLSAASVDIKHVYGTTCSAGCPAKIVFSTNNNEKALVAFKR